jgi:multifunctional beta-oxidation protein
LTTTILHQDVQKRKYLDQIAASKKMSARPIEFKYDDRDVILYHLGNGAKRTELPFVFEGDPQFQALPTFGVVPSYTAKAPYNLHNILPNFDPRMLLAGEHYLEILQYPIPTKATLVSSTHLIEVVDKGNAAVFRRGTTSIDAADGKPVFYNESATFIRGSGGFGGPRKPSDRGAATAANNAPARKPDCVQEEETTQELAVLFRLCGDRNPLHVDPAFSTAGGFKVPILHGLATFGISGKHIYRKFGPFKSIKVRFAGTVLPEETVVTEMWKEGSNRIVYQVRVKETGKLCITKAAVELMVQGGKANL